MDEEIGEIKKLVTDIKSELDIYLNEVDLLTETGDPIFFARENAPAVEYTVSNIILTLGKLVEYSNKLLKKYSE